MLGLVRVEMRVRLRVPHRLHDLDLLLGPGVHGQALHLRYMRPHLAVYARTVHADEDAKAVRRPAGVPALTVRTDVVPWLPDKFHESPLIPLRGYLVY